MELSELIIIILLISCIFIWIANLLGRYLLQSPPTPPQIIYRYRPELDLQFDERNLPSQVYGYLFNGDNVYQGGYHLDQNRTVLSTPKTT